MVIVGISDFELDNLRKFSFSVITNWIAIVKGSDPSSGLKVSQFHAFTRTVRTISNVFVCLLVIYRHSEATTTTTTNFTLTVYTQQGNKKSKLLPTPPKKVNHDFAPKMSGGCGLN